MISSVFVVDRNAFFLAISITTLENKERMKFEGNQAPFSMHLINMIFKTQFFSCTRDDIQ